jgi:DNA-binding NtrC family response regulator
MKLKWRKKMAKQILIVDDDQLLRQCLYYLFEGKYSVTTAENGREGLDKFKQNGFDLVITDYKMPGLDGGSMAKSIRESQPTQAIVMMSGEDHVSMRDYIEEGIINEYLEKPFSIKRITEVAKRYLN